MFRDRADAAHQLAQRLAHLKDRRPLVLGIPRGAIPMARIIADAIDGELDVVLVHKVGAPGHAEFAIGAVSEDGTVTSHGDYARRYAGYIREEAQRQLQILRERRRRYTPGRGPVDVSGRDVVVVDDGSATGATMLSALQSLRPQQPARLVAAVAVAPPEALKRLEAEADEVVCLQAPAMFYAVGQFFEDFRQVGDDEVIRILRTASPGPGGQSRA